MLCLVTGATGFVGSAVARCLLKNDFTVRALVREHSDCRNLDDLPVERVTGDLRDRASLDRAVRGCETLLHVAADYRLWALDKQELYRSNVDGTRNIMQAALGADVERIVYTSSVATVGIPDDGTPGNEQTQVSIDDMIGDYKRSKFMAETEVRKLIEDHGLPAVIVKPSTPVGPRDVKPTPTGRMIADATHGRIPAFVDTGLNIVHVDDVAAGHLLALERGKTGEDYILGGTDMTLAQILSKIAELTGRPRPRVRLPHGLVMPVAYVVEAWARLFKTAEPLLTVDGIRMAKKEMYFSSQKATRELGYNARPAEDALRDAIHWFQQPRA